MTKGQKVKYVGSKMAHKVGAFATVEGFARGSCEQVRIIWDNNGRGDVVHVSALEVVK